MTFSPVAGEGRHSSGGAAEYRSLPLVTRTSTLPEPTAAPADPKPPVAAMVNPIAEVFRNVLLVCSVDTRFFLLLGAFDRVLGTVQDATDMAKSPEILGDTIQ